MKARTTDYFPATLYPLGVQGLAGCVIPSPNINAGGDTEDAALVDAAEVLQAVIDEAIGSEDEP